MGMFRRFECAINYVNLKRDASKCERIVMVKMHKDSNILDGYLHEMIKRIGQKVHLSYSLKENT